MGLQARTIGRDKHPEQGQPQEREQNQGVLGTPDFAAWSPELVTFGPA